MKLSELEQSELFDTDKIGQCIADLEQVLTKHSLNVGELLLCYGNLGYKLGANLRRACYEVDFISEPPNTERLNQLYYSNPTEDVALMLTALHIIGWVEDLTNNKNQSD